MRLSVGKLALVLLLVLVAVVYVGFGVDLRDRVGPRPTRPSPTPERLAEPSALELPLGAELEAEGDWVGTGGIPHERGDARGSVLELRIAESSGRPIADAWARWTPLQPELFVPWATGGALQRSTLEARSVRSRSDESGLARLALDPPGDGHEALWIAAPGFLARGLLDPGRARQVVVLEPAPRLRARVIGTDGGPVHGARVLQRFVDEVTDPARDGKTDLQVRRALEARHETDPEGRVSLFSLPGLQAVHAEHDGLRSAPWVGRQPAELELALLPTFRVLGQVRPWPPAGGGDGRVECARVRGQDVLVIAAVSVSSDGRWGPVDLPCLEADAWSFQLEAAGEVPQAVEIEPPAAGARARVDFRLEAGLPVRVRVREREEGGPIAGAEITASWSRDDAWVEARAHSDAQGLAAFSALPRQGLWLRIQREGFVTSAIDGLELRDDTPQPLEVELERAGRLRVLCTSDDAPLPDYTLMYWRTWVEAKGIEQVRGSPDGACELADVPAGSLTLLAYAPGRGQSEPTAVDVVPGECREARIELKPGLPGRGTVVEASTQTPIPGATVTLRVLAAGMVIADREGAQRSTSDGSFRIEGCAPGQNLIAIAAEGFAAGTAQASGEGEEEVAFGTIGLQRLQSLDVRLLPEGPLDFGACAATLSERIVHSALGFDSTGTCRFEEVSPGEASLQVTLADGTQRELDLELTGGRPWTVDVPVPTTRVLHVELVPAAGSERPQALAIQIDSRTPGGLYSRERLFFPPGLEAEIPTCATGEAVLTILGYGEEVYASVLVDEARLASGRVRVPLDETRSTVRVLSEDGSPLAGARLRVRMPSHGTHWTYSVESDARGEASLALEQEWTYRVDVIHPTRGCACDLPLRLQEGEGVLVLDADSRLVLVVHDGASRLPGVTLRLRGDSDDALALSWHATDSQGMARVPALARGRYRAAIAQEGLWPTEQVVEARPEATEISLPVRRRGGVDLEVRSAGASVAGAVLALVHAELEESVEAWLAADLLSPQDARLVTDEAGRAWLHGVPHGRYRWTIDAGSLGRGSGELVVTPGPTRELRIDLR